MILINDKERELLGPVLMGEVAVLESIEATEHEQSAALGVLMKAEFLISCIIQETLHEKDELSAKQSGPETGDAVPEAVEPSDTPPAPEPEPEAKPEPDAWEHTGKKNRWIK